LSKLKLYKKTLFYFIFSRFHNIHWSFTHNTSLDISVLLPRAREILVQPLNNILYKSHFNHFFFNTYIPNVGLLGTVLYISHTKRWSHTIFLPCSPVNFIASHVRPYTCAHNDAVATNTNDGPTARISRTYA